VNDADRADVARVRDYPFHAVGSVEGFVLGGGCGGNGPLLVAFGANAAPAVLAAKLGLGAAVTAAPASLNGFDVVYSAHVSPYGAIPATLVPSPGTAVAVHLLRLSGAALAALDATEPNYERTELGGGVQAYLSRHGALSLDGTHQALSAIPAHRRGLPALSEAQVLERVGALLEPRADPDAFVLAGIRDAAVRAARTRALRALG
jgi:hypothetical protein